MDNVNTRALFQIRAVNKFTDVVEYAEEVVAEGEKEALFESNMKEALKAKGLTKADVNVLVKSFGILPAKEEVKSVKLVGELGKYSLVKEDKK